ncbi:MAG: hypothetical protein QOF89_502 [Acidobacteriota bacterium]|nr:hypothetical protein [Acidobacteriota bacterium]
MQKRGAGTDSGGWSPGAAEAAKLGSRDAEINQD